MWNFRRYGEVSDPIHKSHLNNLTGDYGCPKRFRYERDLTSEGGENESATVVSGRKAAGTATHETIARALINPDVSARLLRGGTIPAASVERTYREEFAREVDGREVTWKDKDKPEGVHADRVAMITGLLNELHRYVQKIELVEAGFIVQVGPYWLSGHIDLVYRPHRNPDTLAITDWKTTATAPSDLELDHGWEAGVYSAAVKHGLFIPREAITVTTEAGMNYAACGRHRAAHVSKYVAERTVLEAALIDLGYHVQRGERADLDVRAFDGYPTEIYHVAMQDYVPYKVAGSKRVHRPADMRFFGLDRPMVHKHVAGDRRGPAWLPVRLTEHDVPRLISRLRNVVGMVRMGRFIDQVGEQCRRCAFADDCLTSGYGLDGAERTRAERTLRVLSDDAAADAAALSAD